MAQRGVQLDQGNLSCSICLDFLKDPVTIPCGHSYCMNCIKTHWDEEDWRRKYSCPQCRKEFKPRPFLEKNVMFAALVEDLKKTGLQAAPADHCYAGPEDVACEVCTGRKMKAVKSCLVCFVSYCKNHLQPHFDVPGLKKHKLVDPSKNLQDNICSRHDEVMKIFCRTDQQCICYLCSMEEHKGHETVPAAAERAEKQKKLQESRQQIQQRIQDLEEDVKLLQQEVEANNHSADKTVEDTEEIFTEMIRLLQERSFRLKHLIRSKQETEVSRVKDVQEKLEQEITELKRKDTELKQLSITEDHTQFLLNYPSLPALRESTHSSFKLHPLRSFEKVTAVASEIRGKLQDVLRDTWTRISLAVDYMDVTSSHPFIGFSHMPVVFYKQTNTASSPEPEPGEPCIPPIPCYDDLFGYASGTVLFPRFYFKYTKAPETEPKTRAEFLKYSQEITLDLNTANNYLSLSDGNRKVTVMNQQLHYLYHPDRFTSIQVLSRESLTGCCYWEVEWSGGQVGIAVSYKNINRAEEFGWNDKSWSLGCDADGYKFYHNRVQTPVPGPVSSRIGVYLNHRVGILCFYSVSKTMTLLHRVKTRFTQPLHVGIRFYSVGSSAEFIKLAVI